MDNFKALTKLEKTLGFELEGFPLPDYTKNIIYTEIDISKISIATLKKIKKTIHSIGYKWQSGNFIKNCRDTQLTMIS